jgi:hypothetical protein
MFDDVAVRRRTSLPGLWEQKSVAISSDFLLRSSVISGRRSWLDPQITAGGECPSGPHDDEAFELLVIFFCLKAFFCL